MICLGISANLSPAKNEGILEEEAWYCFGDLAEPIFAFPNSLLGALAFRYVDVRSYNLEKLAARREHMMTDCLQTLDCSIGQQDSELDQVVSLLAFCLLDLLVQPASILRVDLLPYCIEGR
jgi:hypothetical protein